MTTDLIFNAGEELLIKQGFDGQTVEVGLYDDSTDNLDEFGTESEITTEPQSSNYSRVSVTLSASQNSNNNWVGENSDVILFNFEDVVQGSPDATDVDAAFVKHTSASGTDFGIIANPSMTTLRNTAAFDELEVAAADFGIGVDGTANTGGS